MAYGLLIAGQISASPPIIRGGGRWRAQGLCCAPPIVVRRLQANVSPCRCPGLLAIPVCVSSFCLLPTLVPLPQMVLVKRRNDIDMKYKMIQPLIMRVFTGVWEIHYNIAANKTLFDVVRVDEGCKDNIKGELILQLRFR